jgi:hypothetical protein
MLKLSVSYHQEHFARNEPDDKWMPVVARNQWILIGHDSQHHLKPAELYAITQYGLGCFYLWGGSDSRWEKMRCFARAYDRIIRAIETTARPFIYRVNRAGSLTPVQLN